MTLTTAGLLVTVLWGAYAFGQFPGGVLGDRYGERNMLTFSTGLSTVAVIAVAISTNVQLLFFGVIAFGFATALFGPLRFTIFTHLFPKRMGTAVGITMASGNVGNAVLPIIAGAIAAYATWRLGFWLVAPLFAVVAVALWVLIPERTDNKKEDDERKSDDRSSLADGISIQSIRDAFGAVRRGINQKGIPTITGIQIILAVVYQGFVAFYPIYLIDVKGLSPSVATALFGMFFACAIVVQPIAGGLQDRLGPKPTLMALLSVLFFGLVALRFANSLLLLILLTLLLSTRTGTGVINNTFIANELPEDIKATGLGLLRTSWLAIGALAPVFIGALGDRGMLEEGFLILALGAGVALACTLLIPSTK